MIVEVFQNQNKSIDFELNFEPLEIDLQSDFARLSGNIEFSGQVRVLDERLFVEGEIKAGVELNCHRCLREIPKNLEIPVRIAYIKAEDDTPEEEQKLLDENLEVSIFEGDRIDLSRTAGEQIALALPTRILCGEGCKGLCEQCGGNRNLVDCKCAEDETDPRWAALKNLKVK